jgi:uncharacterized protein
MIVLDTTVLVYAVGGDHPLQRPAARLLEKVGAGDLTATTTVEVLQEFTHVRARRRGRADAATLTRQLSILLTPLLTVTVDDLRGGLDLFEHHEPLGSFDAVLAAATRRIGGRLVSADRGFGALAEVHLDLATEVEPWLDRELGPP